MELLNTTIKKNSNFCTKTLAFRIYQASALIVMVLVLSGLRNGAIAQTEYDAHRFSDYGTTGTARSLSMGGAFTAIGGDFGSVSINPAGLGLFTKSQFEFSLSPQFTSTKSTFLGFENTARGNNFSLPNIGLVIQSNKGTGSLSSFSIGIGYNQLEHQRREVEAIGFNKYNSVSNYFANQNYGVTNTSLISRDAGYLYNVNELGEMAYNTFFDLKNKKSQDELDTVSIVDVSGNRGVFLAAFNYGNIQQRFIRSEWGRNNEWAISFGGNFNDKLHLGATIGIPDISYEMKSTIKEIDEKDIYNYNSLDTMRLSSISFSETLYSSGVGVNLTIGAIYQPVDFFRVGASIKTPSVIAMSDKYKNSMEIQGENSNEYSTNTSSENTFDYTLYTPFQLNGGVAFILGKTGIISADFGITDYGTSSFSANSLVAGGYFVDVNSAIRNAYKTSYNFKLGGEVKIEKFSLRAGFALFTNPYSTLESSYQDLGNSSVPTVSIVGGKQIFSGGFGYKGTNWYLDFALVHSRRTDKIKLYSVDIQPYNTTDSRAKISPTTVNERISNRFIVTLGFNF